MKVDIIKRPALRMGAAVGYEVSRHNPTNTPKQDLITDLYLPLM
jgi:hypothetical protein